MSDSEEDNLSSSDDDDTSPTKKRKADPSSDNDDNASNDDGGSASEEEEEAAPKKKKKKKSSALKSMIDDAAVLSGSDDDEDEDEEEDEEEDNRDYVRDGFVVDEEEEEEDHRRRRRRKKKKKKKRRGNEDDDLEDTDDDDDDDGGGRSRRGGGHSEEDEEEHESRIRRKKKRIQKMRDMDLLDEDDLMLIREAKGERTEDDRAAAAAARRRDLEDLEEERRAVRARNAEDLQRSLFHGDEDDDGGRSRKKKSKRPPPPGAHRRPGGGGRRDHHRRRHHEDEFDEDALDDFIEDDLGEEEEDLEDDDLEEHRGHRRGRRRAQYEDEAADADPYSEQGVSEAQWNEASAIFGTEYLDMMEGNAPGAGEDEAPDNNYGEGRRNEFGESEDDDDLEEDSESDDLFGSDDDDADLSPEAAQRREEARIRRAKRQKLRMEKKQQKAQRQLERRRTLLRRAYEPIVLVENFCTPRDDEIRGTDVPERFQLLKNFDFKNVTEEEEQLSTEQKEEEAMLEEEEAMWIVGRVPPIAAEFFFEPLHKPPESENEPTPMEEEGGLKPHQRAILNSIKSALSYIRKDKLEVEFIRHYRKDYVTSPAVLEHLYTLMDQHVDFTKMTWARKKTDKLLGRYATSEIVRAETAAAKDPASVAGALGAGGAEGGIYSQQDLVDARNKLDEALQVDMRTKEEMQMFDSENPGWDKDDEVDDDLFGDDDEDDDEETKMKKEKKNRGSQIRTKVQTCTERVQLYGERVAQIETFLSQAAQNANDLAANNNTVHDPAVKKLCSPLLWNEGEYREYLATLTDQRNIQDVLEYMQLIQEGNDAVKSKSTLGAGGAEASKRRSKRFDRDYYRTCVAEGLRSVAYKFLLSPLRAGIKLDANMTLAEGFSHERRMAGEEESEVPPDPACWEAPNVEPDPDTFASDLVSSGELVVMTDQQQRHLSRGQRAGGPLAGCRYVAAMELAFEPRIRRQLRQLYRKLAVVTTRPTRAGLSAIDAFHEYYGLHLIRNKPVKDHFADEKRFSGGQFSNLTREERIEMEEDASRREKESCVQYLRVVKAERAGMIKVRIHLRNKDALTQDDNWYKKDKEDNASKEEQDISQFMQALERVYLPSNADGEGIAAWNEERRNVLRHVLFQILLPQFESETRRDLANAAVHYGAIDTAEHLQAMAMEGPYRPSHMLGENRFLVPTGDLNLVGVCVAPASDSRTEASYMAAVSRRGEAKSNLALPAGKSLRNEDMKEKVIDFLMGTRPAAVLVGTGGGLTSRIVARNLGDIVQQATERWNNRHIQGEDEEDDEFENRMIEFRAKHPSLGDTDYDDDEPWKCNVDLVDDNVAQLFGRSVRGKKEFADKAQNLRCAIALARHAQNPLAELCYAWAVASDTGTFGAEMLFLNVNPIQQLLPKSALLKTFERVLCRAVAELGVDVNASCSLDHLHGLLQFVPGMGPRKAASLKQNLDRIGGIVTSRKALLQKRMMGPVVYNNAVAFLRFTDKDELVGRHLHPLDDTRLHPDVYHRNQWAVKIAIDALEATAAPGGQEDEYSVTAIRKVMQNSREQVRILYEETKKQWEKIYKSPFRVAEFDPRKVAADHWQDKVEELDLETFAKMIEDNGLGKWLSHLNMIKWEFRLPYEDPRKPMEPLAGDKLFRLLTGENDHTLYPGREVTVRVVKNTNHGSRVRLEGDIQGFIYIRNLADGHVQAAADVVQEGSIVTAIVTQVKKDHISVELSLKQEDFRKPPNAWERPKSLPPLDPCFDVSTAARIDAAKIKERDDHLASLARSQRPVGGGDAGSGQQRSRRVARRACAHPAFRNARHDEVDRELRKAGDAMVGEALVRPSSQSSDSLAIHWVVRPGVVKIIEVLEEGKDTDASIGNVLKIKNETYSSIDELLGRFIAPMNDRVEEVASHRKFMDATEDEVDNKLRALKKQTPAGVFYFLCWNEQYPGYASLRYILRATARSHPIGIRPDGFQWGPKTYGHLDKLLNDFKSNPRGPSTASPPRPAPGGPGRRPGDSAPPADARPSRWGARNAGAPQPPPPSGRPGWGGGGSGNPPIPAGGPSWNGNAPAAAGGGSGGGGGWQPQQAPPRPPPQGGFQQPPPSGMPPPHSMPPPPHHHHRPPPPGMPPSGGHYGQPPPPPGPPPTGYPPRGGQVRH